MARLLVRLGWGIVPPTPHSTAPPPPTTQQPLSTAGDLLYDQHNVYLAVDRSVERVGKGIRGFWWGW